jgi:hypothetical protein
MSRNSREMPTMGIDRLETMVAVTMTSFRAVMYFD